VDSFSFPLQFCGDFYRSVFNAFSVVRAIRIECICNYDKAFDQKSEKKKTESQKINRETKGWVDGSLALQSATFQY